MGVERLCFCLGVLLVLPILDARTIKLVPAETKTLTTDDGATHEISRYIVMPDDQTSSPNDDTVTGEKFKITIIPPDKKNTLTNEEFSESKQLHQNTNETSGDSTHINVKFMKTDDTKTPGLIKFMKFKNSPQGIADDKVTRTAIPTHHDSKTTVYIRRDGHDESNKSQIKDGMNLNVIEQALNAGAENALKGIAEHGTSKKSLDEHNYIERVKTKSISNPTKITNIKYTELPIKWDFLKTVGNEKENHALLTSIGINRTFTLPGKRGRFKLIHEDDDDEYSSVLENPLLEHSTSNPTRQTTTYSYNDTVHSVDKSKRIHVPGDVEENNETSFKLLNIENSNQHTDTIPNLDKSDSETNAENIDLMFRSLSNDNQTSNTKPNLEKTNTGSDSETGAVKLTFEKSRPIIRPPSESAVGIVHSSSTRELIKSDTGSSEQNRFEPQLIQILNTDNSDDESKLDTENTNKKSTSNPNKVIKISVESVALPILNQSKLNKDSSDVSKSYIAIDESKLERTGLPIHSNTNPKHMIPNTKITQAKNIFHKNHNNLQVLPLENNPVKSMDTTSTKTTNITVSHSSHVSNSFGSEEINKARSNIDVPLLKNVFSYDSIKPTQNLVNVNNYSRTENKYKVDAEPKIISREDNLRAITSSSPTKKNIVESNRAISTHEITLSEVKNDDSNTNTALKTKNDHSNKQYFIQATNKAESNKGNVTNTPNIGMKLQSVFEDKNHTKIIPDFQKEKYIMDPKTNTLLQRNMNSNRLSLDETKQFIDEHNMYKQKKLTDEINNLTSESSNNNEIEELDANSNIPPTEAKFWPTDKKENNPMTFELFENDENVPAADTTPCENNDILPVSEKSLDEGKLEKSNHVIHRQETPQSPSKLSKNNKNKEYGIIASVKTSPIDQKDINVAKTSYPVYTYDNYVRYNPYQGYDSQTNNKNSENVSRKSTEFIDDQFSQNLHKYLISSNILPELKQTYHESEGTEADPNAVRNTWIKGHLNNFGVLDELRKEHLQYLIQQVKTHETAIERKHNFIYDIPNVVAHRNQIYVPNQYYLIPYSNVFTAVSTNQNARLLQDNADLQHYLLKDYDANSNNNAMNDLGVTFMNIITYLKSLMVPDAEIIQFIVEAKTHLTAKALDSLATECQTKAYNSLGRKIENIAKDLLQRYKSSYESKNIMIPSTSN